MKENQNPEINNEISIKMRVTKRFWRVCFAAGAVLWIISLFLWWQGSIDKVVLFHFNPARVAGDPFVILAKWFSSYGMAAITVLILIYLLVSQWIKYLDAPLTIYLYTICSYGLSGIAGDLLKQVLARPRPIATYGAQILAWSDSASYAIPSGHATKSVALVLPFILLVSGSKNLHKTLKIVIGLIAAGVCFSRIVLGAHYLSDVLAGIGTALIGLPLSMIFAKMILRNVPQKRLPFLSKVWGALLVFLTIVFFVL